MSFSILFFLLFSGGWVFGRIFEKSRLPGVLGMVVFGAGLGFAIRLSGLTWPSGFWDLVPFLKSLALVVILLRAGLGLKRKELRKAGLSAVLMGFLPSILEGAALTLSLMHFFSFDWFSSVLTGIMLASVSPAVVIPSMLEIKSKGLGHQNSVVTTVLAGASVDNAFAVTLFTLFLGIKGTSTGFSAVSIAWLPAILLGGLVLGLFLGGLLAWFFHRFHGSIRATEKTLLLIFSAVLLLQVGEWIPIAALLGVMAMGFMILEKAEKAANELALKLSKVWVFAQIALFVLIGLSLSPQAVLDAGPLALLIVVLGLVFRSLGVLISLIPSSMNRKEKIFCVISYIPKATVQAALGGVALSLGMPHGDTILAVAVISILLTAPFGLIGIRYSAPRLLEQLS